MKRLIITVCAFAVIAMTAGCAGNITGKDTATTAQEAGTTAPLTTEEPSTAVPTTAPANVDPDKTYEYEVREIWVDNNGQKIYGEAYIPVTEGKSPLVIHSHGLGANHESGASYGKKYAPRGIAVFTFDFRGGSNSNHENLSDGETTDMSVMTEVSDVTAVLSAAKSWDFVDIDRIFLQGGSQGGLVTAISGIRHQDEIQGIILHYPAFGMRDYVLSSFSPDEIPEEFPLLGITLGRVFAEDILSYDVYEDIPSFTKPVLIIQGSEDEIVLPSVTKAANDLYPNSEYHLIDGAGHGFAGEEHDEAAGYGLDFIYRTLGVNQNQSGKV